MGALGYYGFLARSVPPGRLLVAAARRAARAARNRVSPPLSPGRDALLDALGCDGAPALAARLAARPRPGRPAFDALDLRRALDHHLPGEAERALRRGQAAAEGRVLVYGREFDARRPGGGLDWQLDPIHGGRFAGHAPSASLPEAPGLDPKMAWALGRGEQWVALACAAVLEAGRGGAGAPAEAALVEALSAQVADFAAENPVGRGVHWTSAMEAGLRAFHVATALGLLAMRRRPLPPDLALEAVHLLVASGRFIAAHLEDDTAVPNNHLLCDLLGLLACAETVPEWPEAAAWRAVAADGLRAAAAEQVLADGASFEGSVPYHRFAAELFAAALLLAHAAGRGLGRAYTRTLRGLFAVARDLQDVTGELPQIGDNDAGHALAVAARGATEAGHLPPLGAALFRDPALLAAPATRPADAVEVAWFLGPPALDWLARAAPRAAPRPRCASYPEGGVHVLRRGPLEVFFACGPHGQRGVGGHDHNDALSLELHAAGALAVCDPGTPCYARDPALRDAFRGTRAHATVTVNGLEQSPLPEGRLFALPDLARARLVAFRPGEPADHVAGEHAGYAGRAGIVHRREVWLAGDGVVVVDRLRGAGTHAIELRWPVAAPPAAAAVRPLAPGELAAAGRLAAAAQLRRVPDPARAVEVALGPGQGRLVLAFAAPAGLAPVVGPGLRSPGYGRLAPATAVVLAGPLACPASLVTFLLFHPQ